MVRVRVRVRIRNLIGGAAGAHISMTSYACARAVARRLSTNGCRSCQYYRDPSFR